MNRRWLLGATQLVVVGVVIALYLVLVTRGRVLGELPW
jgi:hypothetical protein